MEMLNISEMLPSDPVNWHCQIWSYHVSHRMLCIQVSTFKTTERVFSFYLTFIGTRHIECPVAWSDASFEVKSYDEKVKFIAETSSLQDMPPKAIDEIFNLYTIDSVGVKILAGDVGRHEEA